MDTGEAGHSVVERATFFDEQARRRRGSWGWTLACLAIAAGLGVVLSTVITPLLLILAALALRLAGLAGGRGAASAVGRWIADWAASAFARMDRFVDAIDKVHSVRSLARLMPALSDFGIVILPGMAAAGLVWLFFFLLLRRGGMRDLAPALGARPPRSDDFEEHQLTNIVQEMAIAAGLPAPGVLMVDQAVANAAAIGTGTADASVLVTRGVLDALDRDETIAVAAHLVASVGNGDLRVTSAILAVFETLAFFLTILDLAFRASAWRAMGRLARAGLTLGRDAEALGRAEASLDESLSANSIEAVTEAFSGGRFPKVRAVLMAPLIPLMLVNVMQKLVASLWTLFLLGPPVGFLWRTRRYLADSSAVQLTRDPGALARALGKINHSGAIPEGGEAWSFLFVAGPRWRASASLDRRNLTASMQPSTAARLSRLVVLGAPDTGARHEMSFVAVLRHPIRAAIVIALGLLLAPLLFALGVLVAGLTAFTMMISLAAGLSVATVLLAS